MFLFCIHAQRKYNIIAVSTPVFCLFYFGCSYGNDMLYCCVDMSLADSTNRELYVAD